MDMDTFVSVILLLKISLLGFKFIQNLKTVLLFLEHFLMRKK